jgi:hypothetical protein
MLKKVTFIPLNYNYWEVQIFPYIHKQTEIQNAQTLHGIRQTTALSSFMLALRNEKCKHSLEMSGIMWICHHF